MSNDFLNQVNITVVKAGNQVYPLSGSTLINALEKIEGFVYNNIPDVSEALELSDPTIVGVYETAEYERRQKAESDFLERFKDVRLTFLIDNDNTDYYGLGESRISYRSLEPIDMIGWLQEVDDNFPLDSVQTEEQLIRELSDTDLVVGYMPTADYLREKADEERQKYEAIASGIAAECNVRPYSLEFLDAIESKRSQWVDRKEGLREDGICAGDGTVAGYYDLSDGYGEEIDRICHLQDWLEKHLPLLWAQWCESKAANQ